MARASRLTRARCKLRVGAGYTEEVLRNGRIPLAVHAMAEPLLFALLIGAPFLFGFSDDDSATALSIGAGVAIAFVALLTNWRLAIFRVIPLPVHMLADIGLGAFLVVSPFLLGFSDQSAPTIFFVLFGLGEVFASLATRWTHGGDIAPELDSGPGDEPRSERDPRAARRAERARARG